MTTVCAFRSFASCEHLTLRRRVRFELVGAIRQHAERAHRRADARALFGGQLGTERLGDRPPDRLSALSLHEVDDRRIGADDRVEEGETFGPHRELPARELFIADQRARAPGDSFERVGRALERGLALRHCCARTVEDAGSSAPVTSTAIAEHVITPPRVNKNFRCM